MVWVLLEFDSASKVSIPMPSFKIPLPSFPVGEGPAEPNPKLPPTKPPPTKPPPTKPPLTKPPVTKLLTNIPLTTEKSKKRPAEPKEPEPQFVFWHMFYYMLCLCFGVSSYVYFRLKFSFCGKILYLLVGSCWSFGMKSKENPQKPRAKARPASSSSAASAPLQTVAPSLISEMVPSVFLTHLCTKCLRLINSYKHLF